MWYGVGPMRIAWFSPLPPSRSGIAAYSADVLARLSSHEIEAFVDDGTGQDGRQRRVADSAV